MKTPAQTRGCVSGNGEEGISLVHPRVSEIRGTVNPRWESPRIRKSASNKEELQDPHKSFHIRQQHGKGVLTAIQTLLP